jgi:hypothetical protein
MGFIVRSLARRRVASTERAATLLETMRQMIEDEAARRAWRD